MRAVCRRLGLHVRRRKWLGDNNTYRSNCVNVLEAKQAGQYRPVNDRHLSEYIAASAPLHCADGWSLLGRALHCHADRDADATRHLAYYAELRAAMSLLATEGIGVFYRRQFVVEAPLGCEELRSGGTHEFVWLALEHWSGLPRSAELLATVIRPGGVPLEDWLQHFRGAVASWLPIGTDWLRSWGLDLKRLSEDRDARNEASYRPTRLKSKRFLHVPESSAFMRNLWTMCEPYGASRFEPIDRHLLRTSVERAFNAETGKEPAEDAPGFSKRVDSMVKAVAPGGPSHERWKRFLTRRDDPDDSAVTAEASGDVTAEHPGHHVQVMARAMLLLRVATGACCLLLAAASFGRHELEFWWRSFGEERGLWGPGDEPDDFVDLWADIEAASAELGDWDVANAGSSVAQVNWRRECARGISVLGQCERIALWGLGL